MRSPTPCEVLYSWWRSALKDSSTVITQEPQPGYYKRKLVKGGVFVPARIWMVQPVDLETGELVGDEILQAEVNGSFAEPEDCWSWLCSNPITEAEFNYLTARIDFAQRHEPEDPFADARKPIDLNKTPLHF